MSNIANYFITAGFLYEAEAIAKKAIEIQDYDKTVASAISRTKSVYEAEETKVQDLLIKTKSRRFFYRDYALASLQSHLAPFNSTWKSPDCEISVVFDGRFLTANGSFAKNKASIFSIPSLTASSQKPPDVTVINIRYKAEFRGRGGSFRQWSTEGKAPNPDIDKPSATGLMIINDEQNLIRVYQNGTRATEVFFELHPV